MNGKGQKEKRPVVQLPLSLGEKVLEVIAATGVLLIFLLLIAYWEIIPQRIPTHFGPSGLPDGWGGKETLFLLPIMGALLYLVMTVVSRFPQAFNLPWKITEENAEKQYHLARYLLAFLKTEIIWFFVYMQWMTFQVALNKAAGLGSMFLLVFMVVVFGTMGIYFYKSYQYK